MNRKSAIAAINQAGALLVFPIDNRKEPASLWSHFFPRSPMRWEWDESGDNRVANLWHLRAELSTTRKVVYTKWFRGRATYFSCELFTALIRALNPQTAPSLSSEARGILSILESESPLSTKEIKRQAGLQGRAHEPAYQRALKELWSRCLVVAYGEIEDSSFPSLAVGATRVLFEEIWNASLALSESQARETVERLLNADGRGSNLFYRQYLALGKAGAPKPRARSSSRHSAGIGGSIRFEDL